jgi:hypothetical protein
LSKQLALAIQGLVCAIIQHADAVLVDWLIERAV